MRQHVLLGHWNESGECSVPGVSVVVSILSAGIVFYGNFVLGHVAVCRMICSGSYLNKSPKSIVADEILWNFPLLPSCTLA